MQTGLEKLSVKNPAAARLPRIFIACTERDPADLGLVPIKRAADLAKTDPSWRYLEIEATHNVLQEKPTDVAQILLSLG